MPKLITITDPALLRWYGFGKDGQRVPTYVLSGSNGGPIDTGRGKAPGDDQCPHAAQTIRSIGATAKHKCGRWH
jgi:hypothetical protein